MTENKLVTTNDVVAFLNEAFALDPVAIQTLFGINVECNKAMADHPSVQVRSHVTQGDPTYHTGLLGLLNGLFVHDPETAAGAIAMLVDDETGRLTGFCRYEP